nr:MAG TPA: Primase-pol, Primase, REPLICATION [Caudoviricetes sp.]
MYLYPFKIFTISKNKKLFKLSEPSRTIGIYDADVFNYKQAEQAKCVAIGSSISVLLGKLTPTVSLIVLDLDDCFKDGEIEEQTKLFLEEFDDSEWEVSSSGTGIHIYILTTLDLRTFIVKDLEGCKSFECYTNKRHIVTTTFDFYNTNLKVDKHNEFLQELYNRVQKQKAQNEEFSQKAMVKNVFQGIEVKGEIEAFVAGIRKESPVTDMFTLRKCGYKDSNLIEIIDMEPSCVDQSVHDAKLIRKLMYYTFSFDAAWELAKKTNYYKHKDKFHQTKFNSDRYKERTRMFIGG